MKKSYSRLRERLLNTISSFSLAQRIAFSVFSLAVIIGTAALLLIAHNSYTEPNPIVGGTLREGIIGTPRSINPLFAATEADYALTQLVYSGLMRYDKNGDLVPQLAKSYELSENKTEYTFTLRDDLVFHDNRPITVDDVIFTVNLIQDPDVDSPLLSKWDGVKAERITEKIVKFTLPKPYSGFLDSTTIGILPQHLWSEIPVNQVANSELNIHPIGSGPFAVQKIRYNRDRIPHSYKLKSFKHYFPAEPFIAHIKLIFYANQERALQALNKNKIDSLGLIAPKNLDQADFYFFESAPLPRLFGLFVNLDRNTTIASDRSVREAIYLWLDRAELIDQTLNGYGEELYLATPEYFLPARAEQVIAEQSQSDNQTKARELLDKAGWVVNADTSLRTKGSAELTLTITTSDTPELVTAAEVITEQLQGLGIAVETKVYTSASLEKDIIPARDFDILLFGQVLQNDTDLYAFWHDTQRIPPGINITDYTNSDVNSALEESLVTTDLEERKELYQDVVTNIKYDLPVIFLYEPHYIYTMRKSIGNFELGRILQPRDRFTEVYEWYLETERVWKNFADNQ